MRETAAFDPKRLRRCLSSFPTGVTVITTGTAAGAMAGVTVNSFSSVSLDPPLILWSMSLKAASLPLFEENPAFVVNILAHEQRHLSDQFARAFSDKWSGVPYHLSAAGCPVIEGAAATLHCRTVERKPAGDHVIFIALVENLEYQDDVEPLIFCRGSYLASRAAVPLQAPAGA